MNDYISFEDLHELNYEEQEDEFESYLNKFSVREEQIMNKFYEERNI